jgi:hypothetical protein
MTPLTKLPFPPVLNTSTNDIIRDFFNPALKASVRYDRGVGFFSASWLRLAAKGMTEFASLEFCGNIGSVPHFRPNHAREIGVTQIVFNK